MIKYASTDKAGNGEPTQTLTLKIDTLPPATTRPVQGNGLSGLVGNAGWYRSPVTVWLNATDATSGVAGSQYAIDGGPNQSYGGAFLVTGDSPTNCSQCLVSTSAANLHATKP